MIDYMIGDWLQYYDCNLEKQCYAQITSIQADGAKPFIQTSDSDVYYLAEEYKSIPLTSEILEKNGFPFDEEETKKVKGYYKDYEDWKLFKFPLGSGFNIEYNSNRGYYYITDHCFLKFKYVHEFQHILKLCGINKEIKL